MKVRGKEKVQTKSAGARFTDMRTEQDVASPAAAVLERRQSTEPHDAAEAGASRSRVQRKRKRGVRERDGVAEHQD